jgi:hypothetical protein
MTPGERRFDGEDRSRRWIFATPGQAPERARWHDRADQLALALGAKISEGLRERPEQIAGTALVLLGGFLVYEQIHR